MLRRIYVFFFLCSSLFSFWPAIPAEASIIAPPVITEVRVTGTGSLTAPLITGLTPHATDALIYVDGIYAGNAGINSEGTLTDNFYFRVKTPLDPGTHNIFAIARDKTSLVLSAPSVRAEFFIAPLPAPTLIQPNEATVTGKVKPILTGLTLSGTKVHVFIDGKLNGTTPIVNHPSGTANFYWRPFLNLNLGAHTAYAVAEDSSGRQSRISNTLIFRIERPFPAPILFSPVVNSQTNTAQPLIVGLAKNDTKIRVFIDKKLNGEFTVKNSVSGTANFAYKPFIRLNSGSHLVYATAIDERGKESVWSNIVYFTVSTPTEQITGTAAAEGPVSELRLKDLLALAKLFETDRNVKVTAGDLNAIGSILNRQTELGLSPEEIRQLKELQAAKQAELGITPAPSGGDKAPATGQTASSSLEEIQKILENQQGSTTAGSGLIDESKEQQGKLKLNLIIFILFLLAVVGWIFWVNRELIKERREQNKKEEEQKADKGFSPGGKKDDDFKF